MDAASWVSTLDTLEQTCTAALEQFYTQQQLEVAREQFEVTLTFSAKFGHQFDTEQVKLMLSFVLYDIGNTNETLDQLTTYLDMVTKRSDASRFEIFHCRASSNCQGYNQLKDTNVDMFVQEMRVRHEQPPF